MNGAAEEVQKFEDLMKKAIKLHKDIKASQDSEEWWHENFGECTGRANCDVCGKWCGYWADNLDLALQPPLCEKCWEKPEIQEVIKRVDPTEEIYRIKN